MLSRRSFFKSAARIAVVVAAAPALQIEALAFEPLAAVDPGLAADYTRVTDFAALLNAYLPNKLLHEELLKRDFLLTKLSKNNDWRGGTFVVPFSKT